MYFSGHDYTCFLILYHITLGMSTDYILFVICSVTNYRRNPKLRANPLSQNFLQYFVQYAHMPIIAEHYEKA